MSPALIIHVAGQPRSIDMTRIADKARRRPKYDDRTVYIEDLGNVMIFSGKAEAISGAGFLDVSMLPGQPGRKKTVEWYPAPESNAQLYVHSISRIGTTFFVGVSRSDAEVARLIIERQRKDAEDALREARAREEDLQKALSAPCVTMSHLTDSEQAMIRSLRIMNEDDRDYYRHMIRCGAERALEERRSEIADAKARAQPVLRLVPTKNWREEHA